MMGTQWRLVAAHEIRVKLSSKSFLISTALMLVLLAAGIFLGSWLTSRTSTTDLVVSDDHAQAIAEQASVLAQASGDSTVISVHRAADEDQARSQLGSDDADAWLHPGIGGWQLSFGDDEDATVTALVSSAVGAQAIADLSEQTGQPVSDIASAMQLNTDVQAGDRGTSGYLVSLAFALIFMMSSLIFGLQIGQSVTTEKQSRVVEILAAAVPVRQLMVGKVVGNTVIALGQLVLYAAVTLIGIATTDLSELVPGLSGGIVWFLAFFLVGFLALSCLWAAAGAMAPTPEDLQSTSQPLTWMLTVVYVVGFTVQGTAATILSYVPIVSAVMMPARLTLGTATWFQGALALLANLAFTVAAIWFGSRIYRRALLQTHGKVSIREALRTESL